ISPTVSFLTRSPMSKALAICGDISPRISMRIKCSISSWKISRCSMHRVSASVTVMVMMVVPGLLDVQEVAQHGVAVFAQYRLRVKLYSVHGQRFVTHAHDVAVGRGSGDLQAVGQR